MTFPLVQFLFMLKFLPFTALLLLACSFRFMRPWTAPSSVTSVFWCAYLFGSMVSIRHFGELGTMMLVLMISLLTFGAFIGEHRKYGPPRKPLNPLRSAFWLTVIALAGIGYFIYYSVNLYGLDYSPWSLISIGGIWTMNRYAGIYEPWPYRVLIVWFHPACLFGGIIFAQAIKRKHKFLSFLTLLPALLCTVLTGARAAFIIGLVCWLSGYLATMQQLGIRPKAKKLIWSAVIAALLLGAFVLVDAIRGTQTGEKTFSAEIDTDHIADYIFGSPPAFAQWYERDRSSEATLGRFTLPTIYEAFGGKGKHLGVYEKEVIVIPGYFTNVYTAFRGLIQDFSVPGALLLCLLIGYAGGSAYASRSPYVSAYYAFILFSPLVSVFFVNGTILAWAMLWGYQIAPRFAFLQNALRLGPEDRRIMEQFSSRKPSP